MGFRGVISRLAYGEAADEVYRSDPFNIGCAGFSTTNDEDTSHGTSADA